MTGRGIDQVLPHPNAPQLYEYYATDARVFGVELTVVNGALALRRQTD